MKLVVVGLLLLSAASQASPAGVDRADAVVDVARRPAPDGWRRSPGPSTQSGRVASAVRKSAAAVDAARSVHASAVAGPVAVAGAATAAGGNDAASDRYLVIPERIRFARGNAWIDPESAPLLDVMAVELRRHPELRRVTIEGHADSVGSERINRWLSEQRALAVKQALVERGVSEDILFVVARAASTPVRRETDPIAARVNRRVELRIGTPPAR